MLNRNVIFVLGLACGAVLGFIASGGLPQNTEPAKPGAVAEHVHDHSQMRPVPADNVPSVKIAALPEGSCTYNVEISTTNFSFAPQNVNGTHKDGEGHAHIYAGETKLARVYGSWIHVTVPKGSTELSVTLNSNDHATLMHNNAPIKAVVPLTDC